MKLVLFSSLLAQSAGCEQQSVRNSDTTDIFRQDQEQASADGNARRHKASDEELRWTIDMDGCTGHLIAPDLMMTANHCQPTAGATYTSGAALALGETSADMTVSSIVESNGPLDYAIVRISWIGPRKVQQNFAPKIAMSPADLSVSATADEGDELFTVGFPADKRGTWGATYSEGRAKGMAGNFLRYNIGTINGNSGGGVWRKSDNMLVSLTNAGPNNFGASGWDSGDKSDERHWNEGATMWAIYANSPIL